METISNDISLTKKQETGKKKPREKDYYDAMRLFGLPVEKPKEDKKNG